MDDQHVTGPDVTDRKVAFPVSVLWIARDQHLVDGKAFAIGGQRSWPVAIGRQGVAYPLVTDREIALPVGVGRIARDQRFVDGKAFAIGFQSARTVALGLQPAADPLVADREVALPVRVGRIAANTDWRQGLSASNERIGELSSDAGDWSGALPAYRNSLAINEKLVARAKRRLLAAAIV